MKNILGTEEELDFYNKEGKKIYEYNRHSDGYSCESTYDSSGNILTCKNSDGYSSEYIRDSNSNPVTFKNSYGYSWEKTYNSDGNELTFKSSNGYSYEKTYDSNGKILTYKDSDGVMRGFNIPEYTMEELVAKLGNFKIKK